MGKVTLRIVQKYEAGADGKHNVRLRITADRKTRFSSTEVYVTESAFNKKGKRENLNWIRSSHPNHGVYNEIIRKKWDRALDVLDVLGQAATAEQVKTAIEAADGIPIDEVVKLPSFLAYTADYIVRRGESSTTDTYHDAHKAFARFLKSCDLPDISFAELSILWVKKWRSWVLGEFKNNTAWMYHSRLKSMYFQAVEDVPGLVSLPAVVIDPFRRVKIKKIKTQKQRLYEDEIERLVQLDLPWGKPARRARDIAMMMYYAHGMRVGDALRMRLSNYVVIQTSTGEEHRLIYQMGKTVIWKNVLLPDVCIELLAPYRAECKQPTDTLFPYLRRIIDAGYNEYDLRKKIKPQVVLIRKNLINLADMAGIDKAISAHVFRHSFADLARRSGMDVNNIRQALGQQQINTTQIYMDDLDQSSVDEATELFGKRQDNIGTTIRLQSGKI